MPSLHSGKRSLESELAALTEAVQPEMGTPVSIWGKATPTLIAPRVPDEPAPAVFPVIGPAPVDIGPESASVRLSPASPLDNGPQDYDAVTYDDYITKRLLRSARNAGCGA